MNHRILQTVVAKNITLNSWEKFENAAAFFIAPDTESRFYLNTLIINIHEYLGFKIYVMQVNAHMSIGRKPVDGNSGKSIPVDIRY